MEMVVEVFLGKTLPAGKIPVVSIVRPSCHEAVSSFLADSIWLYCVRLPLNESLLATAAQSETAMKPCFLVLALSSKYLLVLFALWQELEHCLS